MNAISLFSGCGGCSLGLRQAGFEIQLAADIDANACNTYSANLGPTNIWRVDLSLVGSDELLRRSNLNVEEVDLIVGGPPCQGFSSAGSKDWTDPRNTLLRRFVQFVKLLRPTWFVMENVEGLLTNKAGFFFIEAIVKFLEAGYWVRAKKVYMTQHGIPERRKRVFVVGNLEQCDFAFPNAAYFEPSHLPLFQLRSELTLLDAIGDLPFPSRTGVVRYDKPPQNDYQARLRCAVDRPIYHHQARMLNNATQQRINCLEQGQTMKHLPEDLQHPSFKRRAFRRVMDGMPTEKRGGAPSGLKRLIAAKPSLTITSAAPAEFVHPVENRLLTLRECARIQSFPDWYEFHGVWSSVAKQIGNAIPPLFMESLANHIRSVATWQRTPGQRGRWLGIEATKSMGVSPALAKMLADLEERTRVYA